jgi:cell division protein FtsW
MINGMFYARKQLISDTRIFISIVIILITIGLLFIYSASSVFALEKYQSAHYYLKKQIMGLIIGFIGLSLFRYIPIKTIQQMSPFLCIVSLLLTALTLVTGYAQHIHGSSRWLSVYGFSFQPSELLKLSCILYCSYILAKKEYSLNSFWNTYVPYVTIVGISSMVLLAQPDFGMTITLAVTAFTLLYIVHIPMVHLLITMSFLFCGSIFLIALKPYRLRRILTFLNPWDDPQGAGFQIIQSLIAIGSGGIWGAGVAQSKQKFFYLPMQHTDFIFSIIAEETGFIGATFLILLYILFLYFGLKIASTIKDTFASLATLGFVILISLQALINGAVVTGLVPTKGIGLPFVSYGNSALICSLCMVGFIINAAHTSKA